MKKGWSHMNRMMTMEDLAEVLKKQVVRRNARFDKASRAVKRVMVAEDVLQQLRMKKYTAAHGIYFRISDDRLEECGGSVVNPENGGPEAAVSRADVSSAINALGCNVCAIGAAFASVVRLDDRLKIGKLMADSEYGSHLSAEVTFTGIMQRKAQSVFPHDLLREMESAFEQGYYGYGEVEGGGAKRMRAIFKNIIANKGRKFTSYRANNRMIVWSGRDD